ncbi:MAG: PQQ-dependent sugar dehydrogenase, partial [Myxococcales bacterium]|nr:PQQ-dependent sugar dehydrogenase [Myxococcales bacterium]
LAALAGAALAACGEDAPLLHDAAPGGDGAGPVIDADPGPADARPDAAVALCAPQAGTTVSTEVVATGLVRPVLVTAPPGDRRLFVVEQRGTIQIIDDGERQATPFLDLRADGGGPVLDVGNEQGLLGLAFHPDFAENHRFFVYYTRTPDGDNVVAEYRLSATDGRVADPASAKILLVVDDFATNHNGGMIEFGPDGYLYIGDGDGGSGDDPHENGQDPSVLLGSLMRIDVDRTTGARPYGIPATNPYAASPDGPTDPRPEIWAIGLRNPWRWSFDAATGDLYIGDVGQDAREEIDVQPATSTGGDNYGWDDLEGTRCHEPTTGCATAGKVAPVAEYTHPGWCSIIGGQVYRGSCFPDLQGWYFYSDYCHKQLWAFTAGAPDDDRQVTPALPGAVTSIHADALGELYVTGFDGTVRHIIATP